MCAAVEEMNIEAILAVMNTIELVVEIRPEKKKKKKKKFGPIRHLNPRPSALPTKLTSQLGAGHYVGSK